MCTQYPEQNAIDIENVDRDICYELQTKSWSRLCLSMRPAFVPLSSTQRENKKLEAYSFAHKSERRQLVAGDLRLVGSRRPWRFGMSRAETLRVCFKIRVKLCRVGREHETYKQRAQSWSSQTPQLLNDLAHSNKQFVFVLDR